jgi:multisubunit Na+/H+ antiporter MnhC subunit
MIELTIILIGALSAIAIYLILQKNLFSILLGLVLFSTVANLCLLVSSGSPEGKAEPIINSNNGLQYVDPLPQALILTAIVIGFAISCYLIFLLYRNIIDSNGSEESFELPDLRNLSVESNQRAHIETFDGKEYKVEK